MTTLREKAEKGDARAQFTLGQTCAIGIGIPKNDTEAVKWYRKAADQGVSQAQFHLGESYRFGDGVPKDDGEAVKWYRKAADQGLSSAQFHLAESYRFGEGVEKDESESVRWCRKAAEKGHPDAQVSLGGAYHFGEGIAKDDREAVKWYGKAAAQGVVPAQFNLAVSYDKGEGVVKDFRQAARWYRKAADRGHADAQYNLGGAYHFGAGVTKDDREAARWYRKAAEQGHADAQYNLGTSYGQGLGVVKDSVTAFAWLDLAAKQGNEGARNNRLAVRESMTAGQFAEAVRLSRKLMAQVAFRQRSTSAPAGRLGKTVVTGTGFFVTDDGYFVTNAHRVDDLSRVRVLTSSGILTAWVVHRDTVNDLALMKVTGSFKSLPVISSSRLRQGGKVFTLGHPNPDAQGLEPVQTSGDISRLVGVGDDPRTLQISAAIQPGNSGGPLVNEHGNVVGVVVARVDALKLLAPKATLPQGVNYAIRSTRLLLLLEEHIPGAGEKLRESFPRTARDPASIRAEVGRATVLILVDRGRP
ncbi:MAG: tetratricopeptide repeat-containing serine protease family protein [Planctomycetales bacterium]|nr:tetratricopeptide repeat-containing serine protease family protein [Planctomycetales bacterium]